MEVRKFLVSTFLFLVISNCTNSPELETGEIKTIQLFKDILTRKDNPTTFIESKKILSRERIDAAGIPIIYVELDSGQNGTLTQYPGLGIGQTWLGADGATITLEKGRIKATRGMGDDVMGSTSEIPFWKDIDDASPYKRTVSYLSGNNKIHQKKYLCEIKKIGEKETIKVWGVAFLVEKYEEYCDFKKENIRNKYYLDIEKNVRRSRQYHSDTLGYIIIERLDRL